MNYKILTLLILLAFSAGSCKKDGIAIKFKLDYDADFTVQSGNVLNIPFDIFTPDITTNSESHFSANDTRKDKVEEVYLLQLDLSITSPPGANFDFLKNIYLYINADGLVEQRIAYKENISDGSTVIQMEVDGTNLAEYIKKESFGLRVETVTDKVLSQDVDVHADMQFQVKARAMK